MTKSLYINLLVSGLDRAKALYAALGFVEEPRFALARVAATNEPVS